MVKAQFIKTSKISKYYKSACSFKVPVYIQISNIKVTSESRVKLLGIHVNNRLNFGFHVSQLCEKSSKKLDALARIFKYLETSERMVLLDSFKA